MDSAPFLWSEWRESNPPPPASPTAGALPMRYTRRCARLSGLSARLSGLSEKGRVAASGACGAGIPSGRGPCRGCLGLHVVRLLAVSVIGVQPDGHIPVAVGDGQQAESTPGVPNLPARGGPHPADQV